MPDPINPATERQPSFRKSRLLILASQTSSFAYALFAFKGALPAKAFSPGRAAGPTSSCAT